MSIFDHLTPWLVLALCALSAAIAVGVICFLHRRQTRHYHSNLRRLP